MSEEGNNMGLGDILRRYALPIALGAGLVIGGCGTPINSTPAADQYAQETLEAGGEALFQRDITSMYSAGSSPSLVDRLELEIEAGLYTVIYVDHPSVMFGND